MTTLRIELGPAEQIQARQFLELFERKKHGNATERENQIFQTQMLQLALNHARMIESATPAAHKTQAA